jgi:hypothetical protein
MSGVMPPHDAMSLLARSLATLSLLPISAYRAGELTRWHPPYALLPAFVWEAHALRIDLRPLQSADVRALVAVRYPLSHGDADRLVTYLVVRSEGNPFFLGESLRTLEAEGAFRLLPAGWELGDLARPHNQLRDGDGARGRCGAAPCAERVDTIAAAHLSAILMARARSRARRVMGRPADSHNVCPWADREGHRVKNDLVRRAGADKRKWQRLAEAVQSQGRVLLGSQAELMAAHTASAGELTAALREVARSHGTGLALDNGKYYLTLPEYDRGE